MVTFAQRITNSGWFQNLILALILLSGSFSGVECYLSGDNGGAMLRFISIGQDVILWIFVLEITLKIIACGRRPLTFFTNGWNVFDFLIVAVCLMPVDAQFGTVLRMARLLRTLRLITMLPRLQLLVTTLLKSIPSLGYIGVLLGLHFYMFAVIGTFVFRDNDPVRWGTLHQSFLTLFQVLTLEGWNDIMATAFLGSDVHYDDAWKQLAGAARVSEAQPILASFFFIIFIMLCAMIMLNLFTGVIITSMEEATNEAAEEKRKEHIAEEGVVNLRDELGQISRQLSALATRLDVIQSEEDLPDFDLDTDEDDALL